MKKISYLIVCILVCVMSFGCAGKDENYSAFLTAAEKAQTKGAEQVVKYLEKGQAVDVEVVKGLAAKGNDAAIALYAIISKERDAAILTQYKVDLPKAPTTQNDVYKTVAGETIPTITRWGFGYLGVSKLTDALSGAGSTTNNINAKDNATVTLDNSKNTAGGNLSNISGDGSSSSQSTSTETVGGNKDSNNTTTNGETPTTTSEDPVLVE